MTDPTDKPTPERRTLPSGAPALDTLRCELASRAQAGLLTSAGYNADPKNTAVLAVRHADALLAELVRSK